MMESELILIHGLLKTLEIKTKTEGLSVPLDKGLQIIERELALKQLERTANTKEGNDMWESNINGR